MNTLPGRLTETRKRWLDMERDWNEGKTAQYIADHYKNPRTGKPYGISHVFWVLRKLKEMRATE